MNDTKWSLVTVAYNSSMALGTFWTDSRPSNVEWIVVDNASHDDSVATATALGANQVIKLPRNKGFAAACNVGAACASGEYIGFVNPDVIVDYSSLDCLASRINETRGLVGPQLVNPDGTKQPNGRGIPTLKSKLLHRLRPDAAEGSYAILADSGEAPYVCWMIGAAICMHRSTFGQIRGWDDSYFLYYEDHDLGLRGWQQGFPSRIEGSVNWTHGWERATMTFNVPAWKRELASMSRFARVYPWFFLPDPQARRRLIGSLPQSMTTLFPSASTSRP